MSAGGWSYECVSAGGWSYECVCAGEWSCSKSIIQSHGGSLQ